MTGLRWYRIVADLFWKLGIIQKPLLKILNPKTTIIPKESDVVDVWSFAHSLAAGIWTATFLGMGFGPLLAFLIGTFVMAMYEAWIDGNLREDPRGASIRDLGANIFGAFSIALSYWIGTLLA